MSNNKRFEVIYKQGRLSGFKIIKDIETGALYLFHNDGSYGSGLTPLLDKDGKPTVDK